MNNEELRVRCAELLGWHSISNGTGVPKGRGNLDYTMLPDYPSDANASREIFAYLEDKLPLRVAWLNRLHTLLEPTAPKNNAGNPVVSDWMKITASPELMARAFVDVMEKQQKKGNQ